MQDPRYAAAFLDLDGEGRNEAVVYLQDRHFCGTGGCGMQILTRRAEGWRVVSSTAIGWPPIRALETRSHGWRDLSVVVAGGGVIPGYEALLAFDGRTYPDNPSVPPARPLRRRPPGETLIQRDPHWRALYP